MPRGRDRGRHHTPRHARRPADDRAHGLPRADTVRRRLVRQRHLRRALPPTSTAGMPDLDAADGRAAATGGLSRLLRARLPCRHDPGEMYLGELNPRVTGASSMTNVTAVAYGDMPLFLFHLLEFMDVDYEIDVDDLNAGWAQPRRDRRVEPVHPQGHRRQGRADRRRAQLGNLAARLAATAACVRAARPTGTPWRARTRRSICASRRGRLPLPGSGYRHPRHTRPPPDRRSTSSPTARARGSAASSRSSPRRRWPADQPVPIREPEPFSFKLL